MQEKKYIFVTGGVLSSIGKGVITASLGNILKSYGYKVVMKKFDPYLNVDSGTMNPYQHGEVYVTFDGGETDLDLGHYERFTGEQLQKEFCITSGQIYQAIIKKEREHAFGGETIQIIPHITDLIKNKIEYLPADSDTQIIITEIGGTVGDIESLAFIEAMRQLKTEKGKENVLFILLTIAFKLNANGEVKTKPTQHALRTLLSLGVQPDILICRASETLDKNVINKIALFSNLKTKHIYSAIDCDSIYKMPALLQEQSIMNSINEYLSLPEIKIRNNLPWKNFLTKITSTKQQLTIAIAGKYTNVPDSYLSVIESLKFAGYELKVKVKLQLIDSTTLTKENVDQLLKTADGILIPGGFGNRGVEGKKIAIQYARENKVPVFGICFGMQLMCIEFAANVCKLENVNSEEMEPNAKSLLFTIFPDYQMQLGNRKLIIINDQSIAFKLYQQQTIEERHRHRYELNPEFIEILTQNGLIISAILQSKEKAQFASIIELTEHPFFIGTQFHPEFISWPNQPHPIFHGFIKASLMFNEKKQVVFCKN